MTDLKTQVLTKVAALSMLVAPATLKANPQAQNNAPSDKASEIASTKIVSNTLARDLFVLGATKNGADVISDARVAEIKSELTKATNIPVDRISVIRDSAILLNKTTNQTEIVFISDSKHYALQLTGENVGKTSLLKEPFSSTTHEPLGESKTRNVVSKDPSIQVSTSQSSLIWLKVFDAANSEIVKSSPGFNGTWSLSSDPLKISSQIPNAAKIIEPVKTVKGYDLKSESGFGTSGVTKVNAFFQENGLDSRLRPNGLNDGIVAAAIETIDFPFTETGKIITISKDGNRFVGVSKTDQKFHSSPAVNEPVISLPTTNDIGVYLVKLSAIKTQTTSDNLFSTGQAIISDLTPSPQAHASYVKGVEFPRVEFHSSSTPKWVIGATADGTNHTVSQALLETKFKLTEKGGSSKTGAAIMTTRGLRGPVAYVIDEPFIVITTVKNQPTVLNVSLIDTSNFETPKN